MQPRNQAVGKGGQNSSSGRKPDRDPDRQPDRPGRRLLSVRTALVLLLSVLTASVAAALMYAGRLAVPLIVVGAVGSLVTAYGFWDRMIELTPLHLVTRELALREYLDEAGQIPRALGGPHPPGRSKAKRGGARPPSAASTLAVRSRALLTIFNSGGYWA